MRSFSWEDPRVSRWMPWIKMLAMGLCAMSIHEIDSNSNLVPDICIDLHTHYFFFILPRGDNFHAMGSFPTYILVVCFFLTIIQTCFLLMLDLRQKLGGVTIQHLIGSNKEPLLLGCANSTKVHPKGAKPLLKAKITYSYTTCNILA